MKYKGGERFTKLIHGKNGPKCISTVCNQITGVKEYKNSEQSCGIRFQQILSLLKCMLSCIFLY